MNRPALGTLIANFYLSNAAGTEDDSNSREYFSRSSSKKNAAYWLEPTTYGPSDVERDRSSSCE